MAIYFQLVLHLTIFLQILFSHVTCVGSVTLSYNSSSSLPQCVETERQALLHFKGNLTDPSGRLSSWIGRDCCNWAGVGCNNRTGYVVKLDIGTDPLDWPSQFSGKLSPSLLDMNHLNYLNLSGNDIGGMVPPQLGNLSNLHYLDLSFNYRLASDLNWLSGLTSLEYLNLGGFNLSKSASFPKAISFLPFLSELHLQYCSLEYPISPPSFSMENFTSLSLIDLSDNTLISEIPLWLINITALVHLDLSGCNITAPDSHLPWENLHNLHYLDLSDNSFWASNLSWLSSLASLEYLNLNYVNLSKASASLPKAISFLPSLSELHLQFCSLEYPISLLSFSTATFPSLSVIDLSYNELISELPPWVINITTLVDLDLSYCKINSPFSQLPWYNLHNLEVLNLHGNSITDNIGTFIDVLSKRSNITLRILSLEDNHFSGQLGESLGRLTSLTSLVLYNNSISGGIPSSIGRLLFLEELRASDNLLNGSIPESFGRLSMLSTLDLSDNKMSGSIPVSIGELFSLTDLHLSGNNWTGKLSEVHFTKLSQLKNLEISSSNGALVFDMSPDWIPPFSLAFLSIYSCRLGPAFPPWIETQAKPNYIVLANAQISDTIPYWFWNLSTRRTSYLDLSGNGIGGMLPYSLEFNFHGVEVDLSNNNLQGPIPLWSNVSKIILRNNSFSGPIPREIGTIMSLLEELDLSSNFLNDTIPKSISTMKNLHYLTLSKNHLIGKIPASIGSLLNLYWLDLSNNNFHGTLPLSLHKCTGLQGINLRGNRISGTIPPWMGKQFESLEFLKLQKNNLTGEIPQELCHLPSLHAIDLSHNNLTGTIPACFGNFSSLLVPADCGFIGYNKAMDFSVKGTLMEFIENLCLINIIDLSNNNLIGELPEEISNLSFLSFLNLSGNQLTGTIPNNIGGLRRLETLDLSHNHLSGSIPLSLASLTFLDDLDLSFNNLSGQIPTANQFSTFNNNSIYEGNPGLCGDPLPNLCYMPGNGDTNKGKFKKGEDRKKDLDAMFWYVVSIGLGFIMGFWGLVGGLVTKRSWRIAYFKFFHGVKDGIFVFVMVKIARFKHIIRRGGN